MFHCKEKKKKVSTYFPLFICELFQRRRKKGLEKTNEIKLEDTYLEEKVQSTVGIGLTYKIVQENLNHSQFFF